MSNQARFVPRHGRVLCPFTVADLDASRTPGKLVLWYPHIDMVVTQVSLVVRQSFEPIDEPAGLELSTEPEKHHGDLMSLSPEQLSAEAVWPWRFAHAGQSLLLHGTAPLKSDVEPPRGRGIVLGRGGATTPRGRRSLVPRRARGARAGGS